MTAIDAVMRVYWNIWYTVLLDAHQSKARCEQRL